MGRNYVGLYLYFGAPIMQVSQNEVRALAQAAAVADPKKRHPPPCSADREEAPATSKIGFVPNAQAAAPCSACSSNCEVVPTASKIGFVPNLNLVDQYAHSGVIVKYQTELGLSQDEAVVLFSDVKRFLYLCATHGDGVRTSTMIDRGWHEFILFTRSYTDFCYDVLGTFIHHQPLVDVGVSELVASNELAVTVFGQLSPNWSTDAANCEDCAPVQPGPSFGGRRIGA